MWDDVKCLAISDIFLENILVSQFLQMLINQHLKCKLIFLGSALSSSEADCLTGIYLVKLLSV